MELQIQSEPGPLALVRTLAGFFLGVLLYRAYRTGWGFVVAAFAGLMYYIVATKNAIIGRILNAPPAVALGNWSYSIYLWHAPTHLAVMALFDAVGHPVQGLNVWSARLLVVATSVLVVALSAATYHGFETPMRRLIVKAAANPGPGGIRA